MDPSIDIEAKLNTFLDLFGKIVYILDKKLERHEVDTYVGEIPWRRKWQSTPVLLPGEFHGKRSLVDYSPWGRRE